MQLKSVEDDYAIIDGFLLNTQLACNLTFLSLVLDKYNPLRRSGAYKSKIITTPEDPGSLSIPGRDSYERQVHMKPGAAFWGYTFIATKGSFSWQVKDACTDVPLLSEVVYSVPTGPPYPQQLLSKLLIVPEPGLLNVEICSLIDGASSNVQLILWGGEPA